LAVLWVLAGPLFVPNFIICVKTMKRVKNYANLNKNDLHYE